MMDSPISRSKNQLGNQKNLKKSRKLFRKMSPFRFFSESEISIFLIKKITNHLEITPYRTHVNTWDFSE